MAMTTKDVVARSVETVTFILAAFSGVLTTIAPPEETTVSMTMGIVSFAALIILLFVSALTQDKPKASNKKYWLVVAAILFLAFLVLAYQYDSDRNRLTFLWPPNQPEQKLFVNGGDQYTPTAQAVHVAHPDYTPARLVSGFGGIDKRMSVWPAEAIQGASKRLKVEFVFMVLALAAAIFCLTEGILLRNNDPPDSDNLDA
jgi:protein-S-isoprenylcysteine O-methyltransferase Ste14